MKSVSKTSSTGGSVAAALIGMVVCPSCIPALAALVAANAPWAFKYWQISYIKPAFLIAAGISFFGLFFSWRRHRNIIPLILAAISAIAFYIITFVKYYTLSSGWWVPLPLVGFVGASILNLVFERRCTTCKVPNAASPLANKNLFTPLETSRVRSDPLSLTGFTCPECNLRYVEESWAKKCEDWCREHKSCNLDIIQHAVSTEGSR